MSTGTATRHRNGRDTRSGSAAAETVCPYCGQPISRAVQARIESAERARFAQLEKGLQEKFARDRAEADAKKAAEIERAKRDAAKAAEQQVKALKANLEATVNQRVAAQRDGFEKKLAEAVAAERTKAFDEKMKLNQQLIDVQRRLEKKTAGELGEEFELDLYEELKHAFPMDAIERIKKGVEGGDIRFRVVHNTQICGAILIDAKNTRRFMNKYVSKLRADQLREQADHAVLVTRVFPAGLHQLAVKDGVVIAAPQRAIVLMNLLRRQVVQAHTLRLTNEGRTAKAAELYRFVTSDRFSQMLDEIGKLTDELAGVDRAELGAVRFGRFGPGIGHMGGFGRR